MRTKALHSIRTCLTQGKKHLSCQTHTLCGLLLLLLLLLLFFSFESKSVSKPCVINMQIRINNNNNNNNNNNLLSFWFSESCDLHSQSEAWYERVCCRCYHSSVVPFCMKEILGVSNQYMESWICWGLDWKADLALSFPLTLMWLRIQHMSISLQSDIESRLLNCLMIKGFSNIYYLMIVRQSASLHGLLEELSW